MECVLPTVYTNVYTKKNFNVFNEDVLQLKHKNVLSILNVVVGDLFLEISMPLCKYTLEQAIKCNFIVFDDNLCESVLSGLKFIHKSGFVHRNLKLSNLMVDFDGTVKLADGKGSRWISKRQMYGTTNFNSPEALHFFYETDDSDWDEKFEWTPQSDLFCIACIFHIFYYDFIHPFGDDALEIECNIIKYRPINLDKDFKYIKFLNKDANLRN